MSAQPDASGYRRTRSGLFAGAAAALLLAGCAEISFITQTAKTIGVGYDRLRPEATYKVGKPYQIAGVWYYPAVDYDYVETGIASWYGPKFHGRPTANGEIFDMNKLSAAHRTLPLPSMVRVTNLENGRSMKLRVNDRGPFAHGRIIDISRRGAQLLGFHKNGTARVRVEIIADESRRLAASMRGGPTLAANESPITVARLPKAEVTSQALSPPPGAVATTPAPVESAPLAVPDRGEQVAMTGSGSELVRLGTTGPTRIYVQAGVFSYFDNADRVRARLSSLGQVKVSSVLVDGRDLFRVRVGPFDSVDQADRVLEQLIGAGFPSSRIVVD